MLFTTKNKSNVTFTTFSLLVERNGNTSCIFAFFFFFLVEIHQSYFFISFCIIFFFFSDHAKKNF